MLLGDHSLDLFDQVGGRRAVDIHGLLWHDGVHAVGLPVDVLVHPLQLDLQLFGTEAHGPQHPQATCFGHRGRHVAAVGEGKDRVFNFERVAELCSHDRFPLRWALVDESSSTSLR